MTNNHASQTLASREIYTAALQKWGETPQLMLMMEESAEFIQAISKLIRQKDGAAEHLIGEIADVQIMLEQVQFILERRGEVDVAQRIAASKAHKLTRLAGIVRA